MEGNDGDSEKDWKKYTLAFKGKDIAKVVHPHDEFRCQVLPEASMFSSASVELSEGTKTFALIRDTFLETFRQKTLPKWKLDSAKSAEDIAQQHEEAIKSFLSIQIAFANLSEQPEVPKRKAGALEAGMPPAPKAAAAPQPAPQHQGPPSKAVPTRGRDKSKGKGKDEKGADCVADGSWPFGLAESAGNGGSHLLKFGLSNANHCILGCKSDK